MDVDSVRIDAAGAGGQKLDRPFAETHKSGPRLSEHSPLLKSLSDLHTEQSLSDVAGYLARASITLAGKEIAGRFEGHVLIQIVGKSSAQPGKSRSISNAQRGKIHPHLVLRQIRGLLCLSLRFIRTEHQQRIDKRGHKESSLHFSLSLCSYSLARDACCSEAH